MTKKKIIRSATIPLSLKTFLNGYIEPLKEKYDLVLLSSPGKELSELHEMHNVKTIGVPMERHISLIKDIKSFIRLIQVFRKEKPYMVHSMTPKAGLLCMVAAWIARVPKRVHTFTGLVWPTAIGMKRRILMLTDKTLCACATHIVPEGQGVLNDLKNFRICKKPMKVLGYGNVRGVDLEFWNSKEFQISGSKFQEVKELKERLGLINTFTFLFVGRLVGEKGINELVEAFIMLKEYFLHLNNGQEVRLLLLGPTEDELDPLKPKTLDRIKTTPSIIEVGPIWGAEILKYYAASDCFVFPSYREGFPNTVLEAGAMGLPSIVTDINGSREIIEEGKNGLIVLAKDTHGLYEAMREMVENVPKRKAMAEISRSMIESRFEQRFVRNCLLEFYDEIMK